MPDVDLIGGPLGGTTYPVPDEEWPLRMLRFDEGTYYADADTLEATFVDPAVGLPGDESGLDPLEYIPGPPGDQGPVGPAGADGPAGPAGADAVAIGLAYAGVWDPAASYDAYDHVQHEGSSYYTAEAIEAGEPAPPTSPWVLLAAAGEPGADGTGGGGTEGAMVWRSDWTAGDYVEGNVVRHDGALWVALVDTSQEPAEGGVEAAPVPNTTSVLGMAGTPRVEFRGPGAHALTVETTEPGTWFSDPALIVVFRNLTGSMALDITGHAGGNCYASDNDDGSSAYSLGFKAGSTSFSTSAKWVFWIIATGPNTVGGGWTAPQAFTVTATGAGVHEPEPLVLDWEKIMDLPT